MHMYGIKYGIKYGPRSNDRININVKNIYDNDEVYRAIMQQVGGVTTIAAKCMEMVVAGVFTVPDFCTHAAGLYSVNPDGTCAGCGLDTHTKEI